MKTHTTFSRLAGLLLGLILLAVPAFAQTATTSTTLSAAIADSSTRTFTVASATNIDVGGELWIDREALLVSAVNGTTVTAARGSEGTRASAHPSASLVYVASKATRSSVFKSNQVILGTCTRANEAYLPQINTSTGDVMDCPVGSTVWVPINRVLTAKTVQFNLDNGAGTTIDALLMRNPRPIVITGCRIVYDDAQTGTVAAGSAQVGTTVGGTDVVAATNYENSKAVGTTTAMVVAAGKIAAGTPVLVRHTGVASTQAGMAYVSCDYFVR